MSLLLIGLLAGTTLLHGGSEPEPPRPGLTLVWSDEFDGTALDLSRWSPWALGPRRDAVNTTDAVTLDGEGVLHISVDHGEDDEGNPLYETGGIWTRDTYLRRYGYFECRMKVQDEIGFWSAFWLNSPNMGQHIGDPAEGGVEIDVMEAIAGGHLRDQMMNTIHWDGYGEDHKSAHHKTKIEGLHTEWHVFALEWTDSELIFYTDGVETWRTSKAVPQIEQYMILSCEVGSWGGDISQADLPAEVLVDYVRVWEPITIQDE